MSIKNTFKNSEPIFLQNDVENLVEKTQIVKVDLRILIFPVVSRDLRIKYHETILLFKKSISRKFPLFHEINYVIYRLDIWRVLIFKR